MVIAHTNFNIYIWSVDKNQLASNNKRFIKARWSSGNRFFCVTFLFTGSSLSVLFAFHMRVKCAYVFGFSLHSTQCRNVFARIFKKCFWNWIWMAYHQFDSWLNENFSYWCKCLCLYVNVNICLTAYVKYGSLSHIWFTWFTTSPSKYDSLINSLSPFRSFSSLPFHFVTNTFDCSFKSGQT